MVTVGIYHWMEMTDDGIKDNRSIQILDSSAAFLCSMEFDRMGDRKAGVMCGEQLYVGV